MQNHQMKKHGKKPEKAIISRFSCEICGKTFREMWNMQNHQFKKHGKEWEKSENSPSKKESQIVEYCKTKNTDIVKKSHPEIDINTETNYEKRSQNENDEKAQPDTVSDIEKSCEKLSKHKALEKVVSNHNTETSVDSTIEDIEILEKNEVDKLRTQIEKHPEMKVNNKQSKSDADTNQSSMTKGQKLITEYFNRSNHIDKIQKLDKADIQPNVSIGNKMGFQMIKTPEKFCENVKVEKFTKEELEPFTIESQIDRYFGTIITNDTKVENKTDSEVHSISELYDLYKNDIKLEKNTIEIADDSKEGIKDIVEVENDTDPEITNDSISKSPNYFIPEIVLKPDPDNDDDIELIDPIADYSDPNTELFNDDAYHNYEQSAGNEVGWLMEIEQKKNVKPKNKKDKSKKKIKSKNKIKVEENLGESKNLDLENGTQDIKPEKKTEWICKYCKRQLTRKYDLKRHQLKICPNRPFIEEIDDSKADIKIENDTKDDNNIENDSKEDIKKEIDEKQSKEKNWMCKFCGRPFTWRQVMIRQGFLCIWILCSSKLTFLT